MIYADQLQDAVRTAALAQFPTDILLDARGFRIVVRNGGIQTAKIVKFSDLEVFGRNPLVTSIRDLNAALA